MDPLNGVFSPRTALVLDLGFGPNIDVDNELLGPIPLHFLYLFSSLLKSFNFQNYNPFEFGEFFSMERQHE